MVNYVEDFMKDRIEELQQKSDNDYTNITIRLPPKDALMLKAIAKGLGFSVSTAFTKILSMHIYDIAISLSEEDFKVFMEKHYGYSSTGEFWLEAMIENGMVERPDLKFAFG